MTLPRDIVIKELMHKFKYEEDKATLLYDCYKDNGKVEELSDFIQSTKPMYL